METAKNTYIASCSFGKDSIATILLALEHGEPLDRVVFAEVMFDNKRGISGEIPEHIEWVYNTAIPKLEQMGVKVDVVRAEKDYVSFFHSAVGGRHKGKIYGFPIGGMCVINRDCKMRPIKQYYRQFQGHVVQYVGIAADEPKRLVRLENTKQISKVSLLAKYGYTEEMAKEKCLEYGLLSPIYETSHRGGCWFCPNCKLNSFAEFKRNHPDMWQELLLLSETPNLCSYGFKYGMSVKEVTTKIDAINAQVKLF